MLAVLTDLARKVVDHTAILRLIEVFDHRSDNRMSELGMLGQAFEFKSINGVDGDYFEFGLWRGRTFCYAHRMKRRYRQHSMKLWGFDSFRGLPDIDDRRNNIWSKGAYACGEPELRRILHRNGFAKEEYQLVPGFYSESLNDNLRLELQGRKAAIVYIDCDLYESAAQVLAFIHPYLVTGTIVCFDDFYCYKGCPDQGEQRALSEFLQAHNELKFTPYLDYAPVGKSFIVRREDESRHSKGRTGSDPPSPRTPR
jgi:O-methyltransferase